MISRPFLIATAGHVDHGKSTLVQALTGTDPDRWAEEQARGITIDLGFAVRQEGARLYALVDVPGHERFVHNMLAGVGCLDAVLLVIAADESIMPQTREHALALHFLQVSHVIVVLSKTDLVDDEMLALVHEELDEWLPAFGWRNAPRVAFAKDDPDALTAVVQQLAEIQKRPMPPEHRARFAVDRVFSAEGSGTVVTGVMERGSLAAEDEVLREDGAEALRIRRLQMHGASVNRVEERGRAALNLTRVHVREIHRGHLLTQAPAPYASKWLLVRLSLFSDAWAPSNKHKFHLHFLSRRQLARLLWCEGDLAMLALDDPAGFWLADRGLIRDHSPLTIVAGFEVLHPYPPLAKRRAVLSRLKPDTLPTLSRPIDKHTFLAWWRWVGPLEPSLIERTHLWRLLGVTVPTDWLAAWKAVETHRWVTQAFWRESRTALTRLLQTLHEQHPYRPWLDRQVCLAAARTADILPALLPLLLTELETDGLIRTRGDRLQLTAFSPSWQEDDLRRLATFLAALDPGTGILDVRRLKERKQTMDIEQWLHREGYLVWLTTDLMMDVAKIHQIKKVLATQFPEDGLTVQTLKALFGFSRKPAIPLLEWMDHAGWTRREGEFRHWLNPEQTPPNLSPTLADLQTSTKTAPKP